MTHLCITQFQTRSLFSPGRIPRALSLKTAKRAQCSFAFLPQCRRRGGKRATPTPGSGKAVIGRHSPGSSLRGTTRAHPITPQHSVRLRHFQPRSFLTPTTMTKHLSERGVTFCTVVYRPRSGHAKLSKRSLRSILKVEQQKQMQQTLGP